MANPQCEDGYTRIANELLEAMCALRMSGRCWQVFLTVIRHTYGWQKKADWISRSQISRLTGIEPCNVSHIIKELLRRHIIMRDGDKIGIQKDYTLWQSSVKIDTESVNFDSVNSDTFSVNFDTGSVNFDTKKCQNQHPQKKKETIPKKERKGARVNFDTDLIHPAIAIYWQLTGKRPRKGTLQYDRIVTTVTDNPEKLRAWRETVEAWLLCDNKQTNIQGMLDWFKTGKRDNRSRMETQPHTDGEEERERIQKLKKELERWEKQI